MAKRPRQAARNQPATVVTIRLGPRLFVDVPREKRLKRLAETWTYILRSRSRWSDDDEIRQLYRTRALDCSLRRITAVVILRGPVAPCVGCRAPSVRRYGRAGSPATD